MSTRSCIAKQTGDDMYLAIYCHSDGYLEYNGRLLNEHYQDEAKVDALIALGNISVLNEETGEKHEFRNPHPYGSAEYKALEEKTGKMVLAYGRDRGEEGQEPENVFGEHSLRSHARNSCGAEYLYLFREGQWYVSVGCKRPFVLLKEMMTATAANA